MSQTPALGLGILGITTVATIGFWIAAVSKNFTPVSMLGLPFIAMMIYYVYKIITKKSVAAFGLYCAFLIAIIIYCLFDFYMPTAVEWFTLVFVNMWLLYSLHSVFFKVTKAVNATVKK
jgi:hypothetical protein